MVATVLHPVHDQQQVGLRAAPFEGAAEILGILQTLVRAKGRLDVHDGRPTSRPGISGS